MRWAKLRRVLPLLGLVSLTWQHSFVPVQRRSLFQWGAVTLTSGSLPALAEADGVDMYFGQGCFWHVQRDMVQLESQFLARKSGSEVTSIAGYAGGAAEGKKPVCYHNLAFPLRDYSRLGHAEAVKVAKVPENQVGAFAKAYLDSVVSEQPVGRPDTQDAGAEYRAMIGLPGGANSSAFSQIVAANNGRLKLAVGQGNDPDTADTQVVWIYDSEKFPFYQAELYHQFHDDIGVKYPASYKSLKDGLLKTGRLRPVSCPEEEFSEEQPDMADDLINFGAAGPDPFDNVIGIFKDPNPPVPKKTGKAAIEKKFSK
eukprot:Skav234681  [mRNA]  locus=scaffold3643:9220:10398:- [translate_table: standard]